MQPLLRLWGASLSADSGEDGLWGMWQLSMSLCASVCKRTQQKIMCSWSREKDWQKCMSAVRTLEESDEDDAEGKPYWTSVRCYNKVKGDRGSTGCPSLGSILTAFWFLVPDTENPDGPSLVFCTLDYLWEISNCREAFSATPNIFKMFLLAITLHMCWNIQNDFC